MVLAQNNFGDTATGGVAGPLGLLIIVLLAIATVLLIRNMNRRLRRLPDRFPDPAAVDRTDAAPTATQTAAPTPVSAERTDTAQPGTGTGADAG